MDTGKRDFDDAMTWLMGNYSPRDADVQQVDLHLLRLLAAGHPVPPERVAATLQMSRAIVHDALQQLSPRITYDAAGHIVAFGGLSLNPTAHRFEVDGRTLYTWCAWDTLFLPALLQQRARVTSTCPVTGAAIQLVVTPERITSCDPASTVVSFVTPDTATYHEDIVANFCCHVLFFRSADAGSAWLAEHDDALLLSVEEAYNLGQRRIVVRFAALEDG